MKKQPYTIKKGEFRCWSTWLRLEKNSCYLFVYLFIIIYLMMLFYLVLVIYPVINFKNLNSVAYRKAQESSI